MLKGDEKIRANKEMRENYENLNVGKIYSDVMPINVDTFPPLSV